MHTKADTWSRHTANNFVNCNAFIHCKCMHNEESTQQHTCGIDNEVTPGTTTHYEGGGSSFFAEAGGAVGW